jgi:L-ascorbate metabolism protein UlaG (beta-lactamase superfamily)
MNVIDIMPKQKSFRNKKGQFQNPVPTTMATLKDMPDIIRRYRKSDSSLRKPLKPIPVQTIDPSVLDLPASEDLVVYWLGHTSLLLELGGRRYLLDPVLSERASMFRNFGPKRMHPSPIAIKDLRNIDAVILSHDHYDHMDYWVMLELIKAETKFYVPLAVGAILTKWGAKTENVFELDWWDEIFDGPNKIAAVPARHFSGRGITNRNTTLWCSWCIINDNTRVYFGGDSGVMPHYEDIGDTYGPFDLSIMPIGAYDETWHNIHIFPVEAAEAHLKLRADKMLPVHWGTFNLAIHPWSEPIEQLVLAAEERGISLLTPMVGEKLIPGAHISLDWWK